MLLVIPGIDGLPLVNEQEPRALPQSRGPLLCACNGKTGRAGGAEQRADGGRDWSKYAAYLESRPDEAELPHPVMISLCAKSVRVETCESGDEQALGSCALRSQKACGER